jgi:hypothetical protein
MRFVSVMISILSAAMILLLFSCGQKMSDDEAKRIIGQYLKYPQPLFNGSHAGPAGSGDIPRFIKGIEKLEADGYIREGSDKSRPRGNNKDYLATDKSKDYMSGIYIRDAFAYYDGAVCSEVIKKIDGVDIEKNDRATIRFTTGYEPIEPFYSLLCINNYCECFGEKLKKVERRMIRLKKYEKGWRLSS